MTGSRVSTNFSLPPLTVVLGGARSGKSAIAERLVVATRRPRIYLATADAWDDEMRARIAQHRSRRDGWTTIEVPRDVDKAIAGVMAGSVVLVDCATLWLTNVILAGGDPVAEEAALLAALQGCAVPVVVVTNEVGMSIVPENALARAFRDAQGRLNQRLAAEAGLVVAVWAGLPLILKGQIEGTW